MVKRQRTESAVTLAGSSDSSQSPVESSSLGPSTPSTTTDDQHARKIQHVDSPGANQRAKAVMRCFLPPHAPEDFVSHGDYEAHYRKHHTNRCHECNKNFPSDHYLNLHIAENHDPLNEAKRDRGEKTYACVVEGCDKVCIDPQRRRWHVVAKHGFPKNYDFFIVNDGIDKRNSMLRPSFGHRRTSSSSSKAKHSVEPDIAMDVVEEDTAEEHESVSSSAPTTQRRTTKPAETNVEDITESLSALKFVPPSVRFGRGRGRGGLAKR